MAFRITGSEALSTLDRTLARLRDKIAKAIDAADELDHREAQVNGEQIAQYLALTDIRLDVVASSDAESLDRVHRQAKVLLQHHDAYIDEEAEQLERADNAIQRLEDDRQNLSAQRENELEAYEAKVDEIETALREDAGYIALLEKSENLAAIAERTEHKLALSRQELEIKGAPYRDDPLFSYLWGRKFRTPAYKAFPLFRFLDGWIARLCKYDQARANYARLTDIPVWLEEHAETQSVKAADALDALETTEAEALTNGGADKLRQQAEETLTKISAIDNAISEKEAEHGQLVEAHADALERRTGPAQEARQLVNQELQRLKIPDLRRLAAETVTFSDDKIVTQLVDLRKEELSLELEARDITQLPKELKKGLSRLENLRRTFKLARYDSSYATFKPAAIDEAITSILERGRSLDSVMRRLKRAVKRKEPRTNPGFGGARRSQTLGLPDVLGDVAWEVLKQSRRGTSIGFPTRSPTRRSSRRGVSFPAPRRGGSSSGGGGGKRGGWKTGGGF